MSRILNSLNYTLHTFPFSSRRLAPSFSAGWKTSFDSSIRLRAFIISLSLASVCLLFCQHLSSPSPPGKKWTDLGRCHLLHYVRMVMYLFFECSGCLPLGPLCPSGMFAAALAGGADPASLWTGLTTNSSTTWLLSLPPSSSVLRTSSSTLRLAISAGWPCFPTTRQVLIGPDCAAECCSITLETRTFTVRTDVRATVRAQY